MHYRFQTRRPTFLQLLAVSCLIASSLFGEEQPEKLKSWLRPQSWQGDTDGPILSLGEPDRFDDTHKSAPAVIRENGRYLMWSCGSRGALNTAVWKPAEREPETDKIGSASEAEGRQPGHWRNTQRPNILLITCDNLGYGDLPCYNSKTSIRAPQLDRLASQGARLTGFYTASPTCTVSRACLLTGRIPQRHGLDYQLPGVQGNYGVGLNHREKLLPQFLKQAPTPYVTGCFGKWNIGFAPGSRPTERGFDEFIGHASGNMDYYHHNYRERHDLHNGIEELHREGDAEKVSGTFD